VGSVSMKEQIWVDVSILDTMLREANNAAPFETGGVLLGYRTGPKDETVVTHSVGAGPDATRESSRFVPDYDFQEMEIARIYENSGRVLSYLGDWHSHPQGSEHLSRKDILTLRRIATSVDARVPSPIMLVLAGGPEWSVAGWQGRIVRRLWWKTLAVAPLAVRTFAASR